MKCHVLTCLAVAAAMAADNASAQIRQPNSVHQSAYDYSAYYAQEDGASPSDKPVAPPAAEAAPPAPAPAAAEATSGCSTCGTSCADACSCSSGCCGDEEAWSLFGGFLEGTQWVAGGWVSAGFTDNAFGTDRNGPLGFNDLGREFQANQVWGFLGRELNTECGWDWGFRADYVFGTDGPDTQCFGDQSWDYGWDSNTRSDGRAGYGSAVPQLYGEVGYGDLSVKVGHFYTIIGYEVVQAPGNFFYTHSYSQYYGEPFTHTGALATFKWNENITLYSGYVMGWDEGWSNLDGGAQYLGGIGVNVTDNLSVTWALTAGGNGVDRDTGAAKGDVYMNSFVAQWQITEKLKYVFQHDLGTVVDSAAGDYQWYSVNQYLMYSLTEKIAVGARYEWFQDAQGQRVVAPEYNGDAGNYYEATVGLNWRPIKNLVIRPECRWDWLGSLNDPAPGVGNRPFNNGENFNQFTAGLDAVFTF